METKLTSTQLNVTELSRKNKDLHGRSPLLRSLFGCLTACADRQSILEEALARKDGEIESRLSAEASKFSGQLNQLQQALEVCSRGASSLSSWFCLRNRPRNRRLLLHISN